jgi:hypothetical protein
MNGAMVIRFGAGIAGREAKGIEVFGKAIGRFEELTKEGRIHGHREFFSITGPSSGFMILDGDLDELLKIAGEEATLRLNTQAEAIVSDFDVQVFAGGDDQSVQQLMGTYNSSLGEIGYLTA